MCLILKIKQMVGAKAMRATEVGASGLLHQYCTLHLSSALNCEVALSKDITLDLQQ
jgi:hypothetical protein